MDDLLWNVEHIAEYQASIIELGAALLKANRSNVTFEEIRQAILMSEPEDFNRDPPQSLRQRRSGGLREVVLRPAR